MFEVYHFSEKEIIGFALMLIRITSCLVVMPVLGSRNIPASAKILLCLLITFVLFPLSKNSLLDATRFKDDILLLAGREALLGLFMGFLTRALFWGIQIAGQVLGFTMGFSAVQLFNPTFGEYSSMMEQFETILATLLFLAINGHHMLLEAIYRSFELAPLGVLTVNVKAMASLTQIVQQVFIIGIKLSGPMIAVILFLNVALGVVGRAVPQINVFVISFPVNILVGLFVFMVSIPLILTVMEQDFTNMGSQIFAYIKGF